MTAAGKADRGAPVSAWYERAVCQGAEYDPFGGQRQTCLFILRYCTECPVRRECLASSDVEDRLSDSRVLYGVRGGLTAAARRPRVRRCKQGLPNDPEPPCSYSFDDELALHLAGVSRQVLVEEGFIEEEAL